MRKHRFTARAVGVWVALACLLAVVPPGLAAPRVTDLTAGDIAVVGYNADDPDQFAFVLLANVSAGTQISFTDNGWLASGAFRTGEGTMTWTAPTDLCAGAVIDPGVSGMQFSTSGDQVIAYQGEASSPVFIYALNNEGAGVWQADATNSNTSALPSGLSNGTTAVALDEIDNAVYNRAVTSGARATLLSAISNKANWSGSETTRQTMPAGPFTVTDAPPCGGDVPPTVASTTPTDGAPGVAVNTNITVNFSEAVTIAHIDSFFDIFCEVSGVPTPQPATGSGGPTAYTIDPTADLPADSSCTVTIKAAEVVDQDGTPDNMVADYVFDFTTAGGFTKIHAIQGSGDTATPGTFSVEAIVVGDYQGATGVDDYKLDGFFIQEEDADADASAGTSEGIFVYCATCPTHVVVGDKVQVTGASSEYYGMSQLNATTAGAVVVVSSGNPLPSPAALTLPVPGVTATDLAGATTQINAYYEPFEGMLVQFGAELSATEYFELFRYGQLVLAQGGRFRQFTDANAPSVSGYTAHQIDLAKRTVILDDDSNQQNHALMENPDIPVFHPVPGFSTTNYVRGGDTITNLTGVLHWSFAGQTGTDAWRIRPVMNASNNPVYNYTFTSGNPRGAAPAAVGGNLQVGSFNTLNFFTTLDDGTAKCGVVGNKQTCRGANSAAELTRQSDKLVAAICALDADVLGLMELENLDPANDPAPGDGIADYVLKNLADALNATGSPCPDKTYAFTDGTAAGTDAIRVGIIYKTGAVSPGGWAALTASVFTDPNSTGSPRNRPALAQTFSAGGQTFTLVVNHLKSKGSCPGGSGPDADQGDGQSCWNDTRQKAAAYLVNTWLPTDPTGSGDPDFLIVGDLNAYRNEGPIVNIEGATYTDLLDGLVGAPAYGYIFDGQLGYLDHALSNPALTAQVSGVTHWHVNADEVNLLDYNDTVQDAAEQTFDAKPAATPLYESNAYRSSDHDPVLVGLCAGAALPSAVTIAANSGADGVDIGWTPTAAGTAHWLWRSGSPYFTPAGPPLTGRTDSTTYTDAGVLSSLDAYYYTVSACGLPADADDLPRVGKFTFGLVAGS